MNFLSLRKERIAARYEGKRDKKRMHKLIPEFHEYEKLAQASLKELQPYYKEYVSKISPADMVLSLELSCLLHTLCKIKAPQVLIDLGSGFSSFVLRLYALHANTSVTVYSIDDNSVWLERTRAFLVKHQLNSNMLLTWSEFCNMNRPKADIVLHDLGSVSKRSETLENALGLIQDDGFLILDDIHKDGYNIEARKTVSRLGFHLWSLRHYTLDTFGRFASIAFRPET